MEQTVNLPALPSMVRIHPPPPCAQFRGHCIVAITSAFQAGDTGSIPAARSTDFLFLNSFLIHPNIPCGVYLSQLRYPDVDSDIMQQLYPDVPSGTVDFTKGRNYGGKRKIRA